MKTTRTWHALRGNRWPWVLSLLLGIAGVAGALVRNRRACAPAAEQLAIQPMERAPWRYPDDVATGRSPIGNGVVRAHHRPGDDD